MENDLNTINKAASASELWDGCTDTIQAQLSDAAWRTTFSGTKAVALEDHELVLVVPNRLQRDRIQGRYLGLVQEALNETHHDVTVRVEVDTNTDFELPAADLSSPATSGILATNPGGWDERFKAGSTPADNNIDNSSEPRFSERLTFEQFVIGPSNRFAHAACLSVAEAPAAAYNPLFIYGATGLGKTHLLRAIVHYLAHHYPSYRVRYVSTETFLNEFVEAIRTNALSNFKRRYRDNEVLLIDDIHFMEGKDGLQEEFFHSFNDLHQNDRQIVLTSDRTPDAMPTLQDRLRSRFKWGLITDIQPPNLETRLAILRKKAESKNLELPDNVSAFIAENIKDSIRELEGALIKVTAYAHLTGRPLNVDLANAVMGDLITQQARPPITADLVIDLTAEMFGFGREQLIGPSRRRPLVEARQVAMYVTRDVTDLSFPDIGRAFGDRDHTTVMHACRKVEDRMGEKQQIFDKVTALHQKLNTPL